MRCCFTLLLLCRSAEPNSLDCRALSSFPKAESISPAPETDLRKSNSPDQHVTALSTSQQSATLVESSLAAPFDAEATLVATIPTTTMAANAVAASDSILTDGNSIDGEAGFMKTNPGDTAPNSAAAVSHGDKPCALQRYYPLLHGGCNHYDKEKAGTLGGAATQVRASCAPQVSHSQEGPRGNSPAPKQQLAAIQTADVQPYKETLQTLDMFDETERSRHRQASKAALRVLAIQEQQLLWAAKSKGGKERSVPAWFCENAGSSSS